MGTPFAALFNVSWELGGLIAAVTVLLAASAAAIHSWLTPQRDVVSRIQEVTAQTGSAPIRLARSEATTAASIFGRLAAPLVELTKPLAADEISQLRRQLIHAGRRSRHALEVFVACKVGLAVIATATFLRLNSQTVDGLRMPLVAVVAVLLCAGGFLLPNVWLWLATSRRQNLVRRSLPDAMDLLVTCVEAGLGLDAALSRVARELRLSAPLLAGELNLTFLETQAGVPRREALRRLAERTGVGDLRQLAAVLTQTEIFGTSVAAALRVHGDGMRVSRMQNAERRAAMVAVKMTIPLVLFILPALVGVLLGPAVVSIATKMIDKGF
jgi:tight adherence protein C